MIVQRIILTTALLSAALLAGCGKRESAPGADAGRQASAADTAAKAPLGLVPTQEEATWTSQEGGYTVTFPPACGSIRTRLSPAPAKDGQYSVVHAFADRTGHPGEGAMVTVYFGERGEDGGPPTPDNVTRKIEDIGKRYGVSLIAQRPFVQEGWEGVRVFCRETGSSRVMWIQGMLLPDRVVIMSAWRAGPEGLTDLQISRFFDSFRLNAAS